MTEQRPMSDRQKLAEIAKILSENYFYARNMGPRMRAVLDAPSAEPPGEIVTITAPQELVDFDHAAYVIIEFDQRLEMFNKRHQAGVRPFPFNKPIKRRMVLLPVPSEVEKPVEEKEADDVAD